MTTEAIQKSSLFSRFPPEWPVTLLPEIRERIHSERKKLVVLDDDPTGTQTVHDVPVLTDWSIDTLAPELRNDLPVFYILTNSRSRPTSTAVELNRAIARNLLTAAGPSDRKPVIVSRSDSTLRGHFPAEVEALTESLGGRFDAWLIVPFFQEGGRYTADDIHYVEEGDRLVPVAATDFARDSSFGYSSSNLCRWVEEKTDGRIRADDVVSISLQAIRLGGPERVSSELLALQGGRVAVVNVLAYRDLEVLVAALLEAESRGKRFLYRTAASFVRTRAGMEARSLLRARELDLSNRGGGLIVVGSHVARTNEQLRLLLEDAGVLGIEIDVPSLLSSRRDREIERAARRANELLERGVDVALYTSRRLVYGADPEASLRIARTVSEGLIAAMRSMKVRPRYVVAKGGITSSDVAKEGMGIRRAWVLGQILPGVPVWRPGTESRYAGAPLVVFPGNVGGPTALVDVVRMLRAPRTASGLDPEHHE